MSLALPILTTSLSEYSQGLISEDDVTRKLEDMNEDTPMGFGALMAEFIAKEIHKGTLLTCLRNAPDSSKLYGYLCSILTVVTTCPLWSRYMREHPDQASPVLAHLATFLDAETVGNLIQKMFTTQSGLICLVLNLPDDFVLPVETDLLLQTLLPKLRVYLDTVRTGSSGGSNIAHLDHYHRILAGYFESQATLEQCQTDLGRYLPVRPAHWKDCAARSVSECPSSAASGQEMMTCGKCQSVRYCSRAHQKTHWKTHKPECFTPVWDT